MFDSFPLLCAVCFLSPEPSLEAAQFPPDGFEPHNKGGEEKNNGRKKQERIKDRLSTLPLVLEKAKHEKQRNWDQGPDYLTSTTTYILILAGVFEKFSPGCFSVLRRAARWTKRRRRQVTAITYHRLYKVPEAFRSARSHSGCRYSFCTGGYNRRRLLLILLFPFFLFPVCLQNINYH